MRKKIGNAFFSLCCLAMIVVSAVCVAIYNLSDGNWRVRYINVT